MKIILLEDNETLLDAISTKLSSQGFVVDSFMDGEEGLYALETLVYDLLILDLGLPKIDGIEIIKKLRASKKNIPILVISARDKLDQRIYGLDLGADDYLCKPFELDEVIARVQSLLRRSKSYFTSTITYKDLCFDMQGRTLKKAEEFISLNKRELSVLEHLLLNQNTIISKENIVEHITSIDDEFNPTAVEIYISRLRKKLGSSLTLKTVRGLGYILAHEK